jgi:hypothetical protein
MKVSKERLRDIIEEEVLNLSEEEVELEPEDPEELQLSGPEKLRAAMPVDELAQVVMKLIGNHPEGVEVLKMAFDELYGLEVAEYEEEEMDPHTPVGPEAEPVRGPIGFKESLARIVKEEVSRVIGEAYTEAEMTPNYETDLEQALIGLVEVDGWPKDDVRKYVEDILELTRHVDERPLEEEKAKNNPWAICTAEVGREDKEKYERCVKSVKKGD